LNIREANLDDLPQLLELEQCVVEAERPYNDSIKDGTAIYYDIENLIKANNSCLLVAEAENSIIATGYAQIRDSKQSLKHMQHSYLGFMYVSPEYRGQGLNAKIMDKLIDWSRNKGAVDFYLDVYADNIPAIKAYEKVGFAPSLLEMKLNIAE